LVPQLAPHLAHERAAHIQVTSRAFSPQLGHEIGLGFINQAALINGKAGDQTSALVGSPLNSPLGPVYIEKLPFSCLR